MISISQAVIVEGKYDKIRLSGFLDAVILTTDGFGIFKNTEKQAFIRLLAEKSGIIVMTDSDSAGMMIRSQIKNIVKKGEVIQVYLPQIKGRERRKTNDSAEGFLGVEGLSEETIMEALKKSGVTASAVPCGFSPLTKSDLMEKGLAGGLDSAAKRRAVYAEMRLPSGLSANNFLLYINRSASRLEFERACRKCLQEKDKK